MPKKRVVTGIIAVTRSGVGFVPHEDFEEDIFIAHDDLKTALNGDTVSVRITGERKNRAEGIVEKIVARRTVDFVGTLKKTASGFAVTASDPRMYTPIRVSKTTARAEDKVLVQIKKWTNMHTNPVGEVVEILGKAGEHETEMRAALISAGFEKDFPKDVLKEADGIGKRGAVLPEDIKGRRDFRNIPTFTIDPADAKDFDDALSFTELDDGKVEVGIHIADVTHYVKPNSALDKEARKRATSVYLVDRTIPMLPEVLSNDICSLRPDEDRLAFSAVFTFSNTNRPKNNKDTRTTLVHQYKGSPCTAGSWAVVDRWFGRTIIRSKKRFSYSDAQETLDAKQKKFSQELVTLDDIARSMRREREKKGAISFETDEVRFELDKNGKPLRAYVKERLETMKLIEDFMLLANREVAEWVEKHCADKETYKRAFIYRIHDEPNPDKIEELRIFLKAIGYDLGKEGHQIASKDIDTLLRKARGTPEETLIQMATLRSMAKAVYSHKNIGHFSLGFQHYTHFTSPIRRYPDMIAHRILWSHLNGPEISKHELEAYQKAAITSSEREVAAVEAERDSIKYKQVEFMHDKIGQEFDGIITGVTEHGIFIAEKESRAEGLAHVSTMKGDYFSYNQKRYALVGEKTGKKFRLGDTVKVRLKNADVERRQIDWEVVL